MLFASCRRRSFAAGAACALAACAGAPRLAETGVVRFHFAHGLIFVDVAQAGRPPMLALLDTGASASAVDRARAADLPAAGAGEVLGTTGSLPVEMVALKGLRLGALPLPALRATRRDLGGLLSPDGRRVDLVLGSDAFARMRLVLDFEARELRAAPSDRAPEDGAPMELEHGIPAVPAEIAGVATWLRIDTGASLFATEDVYINVPAGLWEELQRRDPALAPRAHLQGTGADGRTVSLPVAPIGAVRIAGVDVASAHVIVQPRAGYFALPEAKGFVSNNFLKRLGRVTLDYGSGRFHGAAPLESAPGRGDALPSGRTARQE